MKTKRTLLALILITILIGCRFWVGVYVHDEFVWEKRVFIKHRPIWKWKFYSPQGMSDLKIEDLSIEKQQEQLLFNEFVRNRGLSR